MELRDHERRKLADIERHLAHEDPHLATLLTETPTDHARPQTTRRALLTLVGMDLLGLTTIVAGVETSLIPLIVLGAAVTAAFPVIAFVQLWRRRHSKT